METIATRRSAKLSASVKVEQVFIKEEPDELIPENCGATKQQPRKSSKNAECRKRSRYTQVYPEDLDPSDEDCELVGTAGECEPVVNPGTTIPQCRFCLRRVSTINLKMIRNKHKSQARSAFRLKIYVNDAYPYACVNCLNLLDILLDFKQIVLKANQLLLTSKAHIECGEWDDPDFMKSIASCRVTVEQSHQHIESIYRQHSKKPKVRMRNSIKNEQKSLEARSDSNSEAKDENPNVEVYEKTESPLANIISEPSDMLEQLLERTADETIIPSYQDSNDDAEYAPDDGDVADDSDCPSVEEKTIKRTKSGGRKRKLASSEEKKYDYHQMCDICGVKICPSTAESHRNRHLGIKPYKCVQSGCEVTFHSQYNLSVHLKRAHPENGERRHKCDICGTIIQGPISALNYHKKRHLQEKKHFCTVCDKGFTMIGYLRQHMMSHGDFPHKCQYCGKKFNNKFSMRTHIRNIHEKHTYLPFGQTASTSNDNELM